MANFHTFMTPEHTQETWLSQLTATENAVKEWQSALEQQVAELLRLAAKHGIETLKMKMDFAHRIQRLLNLAEQRIVCPKCGNPATLHAVAADRVEEGCFQFVHIYPKRTTHGGGARLPTNLTLTPMEKHKNR